MTSWLKRFHKDERGLETLQVVLIVAIAAIILALLKAFWTPISTFFKNNILNIIGNGGNNGSQGDGTW